MSVIDTLNTLGEIPGELGVFSIVGSAAFNLLAISGICIISVDEPKKIYDLGVFGVTASFSLFAYIWMNMVLSDEIVEVWEAFLTFAFFFILVILAFAADRFKDRQMKKKIKDQKLSD